MKKNSPGVAPFMLLAILSLFFGLWAGLVRLGWPLSIPAPLPMQHGALMVSGFLGTLIALERAAAIRQRWMYAAPLSSGIGWILCLAAPDLLIGPLLITLGSLFTTAILGTMVKQHAQIYTVSMAIGAACWLIGNLLWVLGTPVYLVVWWWAAFLVLTIAGERLELSRVTRLGKKHYLLFTMAAGLFLIGVLLYTGQPAAGARVIGAGTLALSAWLLRYDIARRNMVRSAGLPRFVATCLFTGYLWLGLSGIFNLAFGAQVAGPLYDAVLHSLFVGFVMAMIFGHAPIIFPALIGKNVAYHSRFYLPLILLQFSLILRVIGDVWGWAAGRLWGGLLNEVAILAFMGILIFTFASKKRVVAAEHRATDRGLAR